MAIDVQRIFTHQDATLADALRRGEAVFLALSAGRSCGAMTLRIAGGLDGLPLASLSLIGVESGEVRAALIRQALSWKAGEGVPQLVLTLPGVKEMRELGGLGFVTTPLAVIVALSLSPPSIQERKVDVPTKSKRGARSPGQSPVPATPQESPPSPSLADGGATSERGDPDDDRVVPLSAPVPPISTGGGPSGG